MKHAGAICQRREFGLISKCSNDGRRRQQIRPIVRDHSNEQEVMSTEVILDSIGGWLCQVGALESCPGAMQAIHQA